MSSRAADSEAVKMYVDRDKDCATQRHKSSSSSSLRSVPYPHQVGGHGQLRQLPSGKLLKPLYEKESNFYNFIHSNALPLSLRWLRKTTPHFFGECATPLTTSDDDQHDSNNMLPGSGSHMQWVDAESTTYMSPWAVTMGRRLKMKKSSNRPGASICLEDVNHGFAIPCVLDCKVGTRHYDDDATAEKRRKHIEKSERTTSAKHGIRFTGMQSYKRHRGVYEFRDKYHGRKMNGADLVPQMRWFFHDGRRLRDDCARVVLQKLRDIRARMAEQTMFKFYSSSLLLVYEGGDGCRGDVRMIDFAHTQWNCDGQGHVDQGYLLGVDTLIQILQSVLHTHHQHDHDDDDDVNDGNDSVDNYHAANVAADSGCERRGINPCDDASTNV